MVDGISRVGSRCFVFFFFKQKTAYEIKECDWSSDVCSSDLPDQETERLFFPPLSSTSPLNGSSHSQRLS